VLRWSCSIFILGVAFATLAGVLIAPGNPVYLSALMAQLTLYAAAFAGYYSTSTALLPRLARLTTMFAAMNLALLAGFYLWISGRQKGVWQRTARTGV
jgi:hypothetical protein